MNTDFLDPAFSLRVAETLLHFLWQGLAIGLLMWLINASIAHSRSNLRYRINLSALCLMAACLPLTFALLPADKPGATRTTDAIAAITPDTSTLTVVDADPVESTERPLESPPAPQPSGRIVETGDSEADTFPSGTTADTEEAIAAGTAFPFRSWVRRISSYATAAYVVGVLLMLLRLLIAVRGGQRLRKSSQPIDASGLLENVERLARRLGLKVAPVVASSSRISVPVVVGLVKPLILLPPALVTGLPADQLDAILSHELVHLRRCDPLINLLQRLIEAVLFFHPAVWYVSHRVSIERESSCDDLVMAHGCDRLTYADALLRMAEICALGSGKQLPGSLIALAATGKNPSEFKRRVLRVVGESSGPGLRLTRGGLAVFAAMVICIVALPFVMQLRAAGTPEDEHDPSEDHASITDTLDKQMREVIGRFDPEYWKTVDIPKLIGDKQIAFSPDREVLALLRGETLYAIESLSGQYQSYQLTEKVASIEWKSGSIHVSTEGSKDRFYEVQRPRIQFLDRRNEPTSEECLVKARIGLSGLQNTWMIPQDNWVMHSYGPAQPISLMGLKPGTHWLVAGPSRDVFAVSLPLGSRDPNLPEDVILRGEVTKRKTPSGTVREIRRQLQPQPRIKADNVFATASVKKLDNWRETLQITIRNNSGKRLQFSEQNIHLETEVDGRYQEVLSPGWTQEDGDTRWTEIVIEQGSEGIMELDWNRWCSRGLWFGGGSFHAFGPALGDAPPGKLQVRVHGPGIGTLPVAMTNPAKVQESAWKFPKVPKSAWGEAKNGLRLAAVPDPDTVPLGELIPFVIIVENVSDHDIRFTTNYLTQTARADIRRTNRNQVETQAAGQNSGISPPDHYQLRPGQQAIVAKPSVRVVEEGVEAGDFEDKPGCTRAILRGDKKLRNNIFNVRYSVTLNEAQLHEDDEEKQGESTDEREWAGTLTSGVMAINAFRPVPKPPAVSETPTNEASIPPEPVDAHTLELYNTYIAKVGKIESSSIDAAIKLVAARGYNNQSFRELLRKDFATSRQEDNQRYDSRKLLELIATVLDRYGGWRWNREYAKRTGNPRQQATPSGVVLDGESPLLADVIKYGRKCDRHEIDAFVFAVRESHHPQGKQFLLDVLHNNPVNPGDSSNAGTGVLPAEAPADPGSTNEADKTPGKWPDNRGGGWGDARFLAAVGLAELGEEAGVRWLIDHARPNEFGLDGTVYHHSHFHVTSGSLRENCNAVLHDFSKLPGRGEEPSPDWDKWWQENKDSFTPRPAALRP